MMPKWILPILIATATSYSILNIQNQLDPSTINNDQFTTFRTPIFPDVKIRAKRSRLLCDTTVDQVTILTRFMGTWIIKMIVISIFGSSRVGPIAKMIHFCYG